MKYKLLFFLFLLFNIINCKKTLLPFPTFILSAETNIWNYFAGCLHPSRQNALAPTLRSDGFPLYAYGNNPYIINDLGTDYTIFKNQDDFYRTLTPIPCENYLNIHTYEVKDYVIGGYTKLVSLMIGVWPYPPKNYTIENALSHGLNTSTAGLMSFYGYAPKDGTPVKIETISRLFSNVYINGKVIPFTCQTGGFETATYTGDKSIKPGDRVNITIYGWGLQKDFYQLIYNNLENINCDKDKDGICGGRNLYDPPLPSINACQEYDLQCNMTVVKDKQCTSMDPCKIAVCDEIKGCMLSPIVCDASNDSPCLRNTCQRGLCVMVQNCTTTTSNPTIAPTTSGRIGRSSTSGSRSTTSIPPSTSSITSISPRITSSQASTISRQSTSSSVSSSQYFTGNIINPRTFSSSGNTRNKPKPKYYCNENSCPHGFECIQLFESYTCISRHYCEKCNPDILKEFY